MLLARGNAPCIAVGRLGELCAGDSGRVGSSLSSVCGEVWGVWKPGGEGGAGAGRTGVRIGAGWAGGTGGGSAEAGSKWSSSSSSNRGRFAACAKYRNGSGSLAGVCESGGVVEDVSSLTGLVSPSLQLFTWVEIGEPLSRGTSLRLLLGSSSRILYGPLYRSANFLRSKFL